MPPRLRRTAARTAPPQDDQRPAAERAALMLRAVEAVEQLLPPAPPEPTPDWPERTGELGKAVADVRRLAVTFKPEDWHRAWPRPRCNRCGGNGWYWLDPDMDSRGWEPCHPCLTTGVQLQTDRWNPATTHADLEPYER